MTVTHDEANGLPPTKLQMRLTRNYACEYDAINALCIIYLPSICNVCNTWTSSMNVAHCQIAVGVGINVV
jgi:hypothetical protein